MSTWRVMSYEQRFILILFAVVSGIGFGMWTSLGSGMSLALGIGFLLVNVGFLIPAVRKRGRSKRLDAGRLAALSDDDLAAVESIAAYERPTVHENVMAFVLAGDSLDLDSRFGPEFRPLLTRLFEAGLLEIVAQSPDDFRPRPYRLCVGALEAACAERDRRDEESVSFKRPGLRSRSSALAERTA